MKAKKNEHFKDFQTNNFVETCRLQKLRYLENANGFMRTIFRCYFLSKRCIRAELRLSGWKNKIKVDFERKNRNSPDPEMNTFSQFKNPAAVRGRECFSLISDTQPFHWIYHRSRLSFFMPSQSKHDLLLSFGTPYYCSGQMK